MFKKTLQLNTSTLSIRVVEFTIYQRLLLINKQVLLQNFTRYINKFTAKKTIILVTFIFYITCSQANNF